MIAGREGVNVVLRFDRIEAHQLRELFSGVSALIGEADLDDPARARLLPAGHRDDLDVAQEFRELTEQSLIAAKQGAIGQCIAELSSAGHAAQRSDARRTATPTSSVDVVLQDDGLQRWLQALNGVRLAIGTRLETNGVDLQDEDRFEELDAIDDESGEAESDLRDMSLLYRWVTWIQGDLVELAMAEGRPR